jgi:nucleoside-diphosphate-sugar epimerase
MNQDKEVVLLTGASGSMGHETFLRLWEQREKYDLVLLLRPSKKNKKQFRSYEKSAGIAQFPGSGVARGNGLKIVWGDALDRENLEEACTGIDWCLHTMALISPAADRDPEMTWKVNTEVTRNLVDIVESTDPDGIRMVYIGSVAQYGDRLPPVHVGRTGDPLIPSRYDMYAISKIAAERAVMESRIKHRVSLRQTFIMIPDLFSLMDPIMFHQPLWSMMENITARDAGRMLAACLEIPGDSGFWGGYFNISGGPGCRITYLEFMDRIYRLLGINYQRVMERNWFALKNFHMQFYEDTGSLNDYLHHWEGGQVMDDYIAEVWKKLSWYMKLAAWYSRHLPPFRWIVELATRIQLRRLSEKKRGTMHWIRHNDTGRIEAFFGSLDAWKEIGDWSTLSPDMDHSQPYQRLDHGYDESKQLLGLDDLRQAARFRGGDVENKKWDGDLDQKLQWHCARNHRFTLTPRSVLKGGHWCMECIAPPWDYSHMSRENPFAAQIFPLSKGE